MNPQPPNNPQAWLEEQLRREAALDRPEFSPLLHARIMAALPTQQAPARRHATAWSALAATILLAIGLWAWRPGIQTRPPTSPPLAVVPPRLPDLPSLMPPQRRQQLEQELWESRLAYLDQDAQRLGRFLLDQLPRPPQ